jgi:phosphoglycolate phosphatase-like HAD superfamily hydrolase
MTQLHGVILDIDGTLVDSNDANAHYDESPLVKGIPTSTS